MALWFITKNGVPIYKPPYTKAEQAEQAKSLYKTPVATARAAPPGPAPAEAPPKARPPRRSRGAARQP